MNTNATWGGRFNKAPEQEVSDYTESQSYDRVLYKHDILASQAHAKMLGIQNIITQEESSKIISGLEQIKEEIEKDLFTWKVELEDVHMNIESRLIELIGDVGKKLHTGRSRNDQIGLTFRLFVTTCLEQWKNSLINLCSALYIQASKNQDTILPGYTHLQPAQPVSLAHHLLAYAWMFKRDYLRIDDCLKRVKISPLGAAALAGTTYPLNPYQVANDVGFDKVYENSMDAVSDRDYVLESLFCASTSMMHLSRLCEEIIIWANPAFGFIKLPDNYSTGSSIMPQKKNPDVAELMRGKTGRVYGALTCMLTIMKGLPLTYNRDMQEDKEGFLDTNKTYYQSLNIMTGMIKELTFQKKSMANACKAGFLNATELADYLVSKGISFRQAHHITGQAVALAEKEDKALEDLTLDQLKEFSPLIDNEVFPLLEFNTAVKRRETIGGTGPNSVKKQLNDLSNWIEQQKQ